jgi:hypothetical protein
MAIVNSSTIRKQAGISFPLDILRSGIAGSLLAICPKEIIRNLCIVYYMENYDLKVYQ